MNDDAHGALVELGQRLMSFGYRFTTVTPETHRRVNARAPLLARDARGVFGWSRPFEPGALPDGLLDLLRAADALTETADGFASRVRFSTIGAHLFVHSAYPTVDADAVFFGPDTYRFCRAIVQARGDAARVLDLGCGSGAGGVFAAQTSAARGLVLADVNPRALAFSRVNVALAAASGAPCPAEVELVRSDLFSAAPGPFDLIVANPPYMKDSAGRAYRDGGGRTGEALSVRIVDEAIEHLAPGGRLLLYTGVAMEDAADPFWQAISARLRDAAIADVTYEEVDPDVFGDELDRPAYTSVERIAAVVLCLSRRR